MTDGAAPAELIDRWSCSCAASGSWDGRGSRLREAVLELRSQADPEIGAWLTAAEVDRLATATGQHHMKRLVDDVLTAWEACWPQLLAAVRPPDRDFRRLVAAMTQLRRQRG